MRSECRQGGYMVRPKAPALNQAAGDPCPTPPTPCLGGMEAPQGPQGHQTIAGLLQGPAVLGRQAQLEQHSPLPDWPWGAPLLGSAGQTYRKRE